MTREQQRKLKTLKSSLMKIAQPYLKKYGLKKKDFMIWCERDGLFFGMHLYIGEREGKIYSTVRATVKPLWMDDILWEILDMESNKQEPMSLRSTGAFTIRGAKVYAEDVELTEWTIAELEGIVARQLEEFAERIKNVTLDDFYRLAEEADYQRDLIGCIILIYQKKYAEARAKITEMQSDYFVTGGLGVRERAMRYIEKQETFGRRQGAFL